MTCKQSHGVDFAGVRIVAVVKRSTKIRKEASGSGGPNETCARSTAAKRLDGFKCGGVLFPHWRGLRFGRFPVRSWGSARQPVGRWGGWKLRPPKPALASPAHRGAERNGSSTLHSSLEPTRARRWDGGGNPGPRLKSGEQALPERVGGWRFAAGRRRVGRAQRRQGRMVAARTAMGKGVLQVGPLVLVVSTLCKSELSRGGLKVVAFCR